MAAIPDITDTERWVMQTTLRERYGREVPFDLADADVRLHPSERDVTLCPLIYWQSDDRCSFVIVKSGERKCRSQFFLLALQADGDQGGRVRRPRRVCRGAAPGPGRLCRRAAWRPAGRGRLTRATNPAARLPGRPAFRELKTN